MKNTGFQFSLGKMINFNLQNINNLQKVVY